MDGSVEDLLRKLAPQVLGALTRRYGHFDIAEEAVQDALLIASEQWPADGIPTGPQSWLIRIASRRMIDQLRADQARRRREATVAARTPLDEWLSPAADQWPGMVEDDSLILLMLCCHPALSSTSQVALTLRAVGGLSTAEIAGAFLVPEPTMAQRISRAKRQIERSGARFRLPPTADRADRVAAVLRVLYLIFNEGYTTTSGPRLHRVELSVEAIRLTRMLRELVPADGEVAGLLALMLLTDARRPARVAADGSLVPMAEQDRRRWDAGAIAEGTELVTWAMSSTELGPYQLQAAIAAVHAEAERDEDTDWRQILALYSLLRKLDDNPVILLNQAVAVAMVHGPRAGLTSLEPLDREPRLADHHRLSAVRAHLFELAGEPAAAAALYREAAQRTTSIPEQRYLLARLARLSS
ncbi:MAG TPA: DUF6596 domain-containing protein [Kribbella sp.]|nr:DUF6596 domain-containing protein [Kribbella sp.]